MAILSLRDFNRHWVDYLVGEGVRMFYDYSMLSCDPPSEWLPDLKLIGINPATRLEGKRLEDHAINHEWLHAFEYLVMDLDLHTRHSEDQINWWAWFYYRNDPSLTDYIRRNGVIGPQRIPERFSFLQLPLL